MQGLHDEIERLQARCRELEAIIGHSAGTTERTLRALIDAAPFGSHEYELQPDGRLVFLGANRSAQRLLGVDHTQFVGKTIEEAFPELASTPIPQAYRDVVKTGVPYQKTEITYQDDRVAGAFEIWAFQTTPNRMAVLFRDVTEKTRAEEALRESERKFRNLFDTMAQGVVYQDATGQITDANPAAERILGLTRDQLLGKTSFDPRWKCVREDGTDMAGDEHPSMIALKTGKPVMNAIFGVSVPEVNAYRWIMVSAVPEFNQGSDRPCRAYATITDITAQRHAAEDKRRMEAQMQHTQKLESLGVLAGGIAHDFNNLLMAIIGHIDLAKNALSFTSPIRNDLESAELASRRAADLCRQMLAYSGKGRFVIEAIALDQIVREMSHMLEVSISKRARLHLDMKSDIPSIEADLSQIHQVVMNLIINASEAIADRNGLIRVSTGTMHCDRAYLTETWIDDDLPEGTYVYLEVTDDGCGMDAATIKRIFDPFFTTKFTGRGLGLSAVLGIVRGHRGAIKIYSESGKGTSFKVLFPASEKPRAGARTPASVPEENWTGSGTVLLIDDDLALHLLGQEMLNLLGFKVILANRGRQALEIFAEFGAEISIVLLDLTMPDLDGEETFRELRRLDPNVQVLLTSGYNEQHVTQRFVGKGLAGFIQKPYQLADLRRKLREILLSRKA